jgi:hypothetical protein
MLSDEYWKFNAEEKQEAVSKYTLFQSTTEQLFAQDLDTRRHNCSSMITWQSSYKLESYTICCRCFFYSCCFGNVDAAAEAAQYSTWHVSIILKMYIYLDANELLFVFSFCNCFNSFVCLLLSKKDMLRGMWRKRRYWQNTLMWLQLIVVKYCNQ